MSEIAPLGVPARIHIQSQQKSKIGKCRLRFLIFSTGVIVTKAITVELIVGSAGK